MFFSVLECSGIPTGGHRIIQCQEPRFILGRTCTVGCNIGYEMVPQTANNNITIQCIKDGESKSKYSRDVPTCKGINLMISAAL